MTTIRRIIKSSGSILWNIWADFIWEIRYNREFKQNIKKQGGVIKQKSTLERFNPEDSVRGEKIIGEDVKILRAVGGKLTFKQSINIRKLLSFQKQEIVEKIENLKKDIRGLSEYDKYNRTELYKRRKSYNCAIQEVLKIFKQTLNK